jgi:hypothetical protein
MLFFPIVIHERVVPGVWEVALLHVFLYGSTLARIAQDLKRAPPHGQDDAGHGKKLRKRAEGVPPAMSVASMGFLQIRCRVKTATPQLIAKPKSISVVYW